MEQHEGLEPANRQRVEWGMARKPAKPRRKRTTKQIVKQNAVRSRAMIDAARWKRRDDAIKLALAGLSTREISEHPEFVSRHGSLTHVTVAKDISIMLEQTVRETEDTKRLRAIKLAQLEMLRRTWWAKAKRDLHALDRVLGIMRDQARLDGSLAPARVALGGDKDAPPIKVDVTEKPADPDANRSVFEDMPLDTLRKMREMRDEFRSLAGGGVTEAEIIEVTADDNT